jgi:hypothetical protein
MILMFDFWFKLMQLDTTYLDRENVVVEYNEKMLHLLNEANKVLMPIDIRATSNVFQFNYVGASLQFMYTMLCVCLYVLRLKIFNLAT